MSGRGFLRFALALGGGLLALRLRLRVALGLLTVALDALLALLGGDFVLQASALGLGLGLLGLERRLGVALPRLGGLCARLRLGVDLRLLQTTFSGQIVVANQRSGGFLGFAGKLADEPTRGSLGVLVISQNRSSLSSILENERSRQASPSTDAPLLDTPTPDGQTYVRIKGWIDGSEDQLQELADPRAELAGEARESHPLMNNCYRDYGVRNAFQLRDLLLDAR